PYTVLPFFFFNHPPTTVFYTLSLHDALPIYRHQRIDSQEFAAGDTRHINRRLEHVVLAVLVHPVDAHDRRAVDEFGRQLDISHGDRKSTRLNSSHVAISYAVFCLKKKKKKKK